jgi:hypothetical protein
MELIVLKKEGPGFCNYKNDRRGQKERRWPEVNPAVSCISLLILDQVPQE